LNGPRISTEQDTVYDTGEFATLTSKTTARVTRLWRVAPYELT
jgi:hypothetical protein